MSIKKIMFIIFLVSGSAMLVYALFTQMQIIDLVLASLLIVNAVIIWIVDQRAKQDRWTEMEPSKYEEH